MAYTVIWTEKALKILKQLPQKTAARIVTSVEKLRDSPLDHLYPLQGSPYYKLRVGNYRVVIWFAWMAFVHVKESAAFGFLNLLFEVLTVPCAPLAGHGPVRHRTPPFNRTASGSGGRSTAGKQS